MKLTIFLLGLILSLWSCKIFKSNKGRNSFVITALHKNILSRKYNENTSPSIVCLKEKSAFELRNHKMIMEFTYPRMYLGHMLGGDTSKLVSLTDTQIRNAINEFYTSGRKRLENNPMMRDSILNSRIKANIIENINEENGTAIVDLDNTFTYYLRRDPISNKWRIIKYDRY